MCSQRNARRRRVSTGSTDDPENPEEMQGQNCNCHPVVNLDTHRPQVNLGSPENQTGTKTHHFSSQPLRQEYVGNLDFSNQ